MATRLMYKALATAALSIALSLVLAAPTTASSASSNTAGARQLDPPAAPSHCRARTYFDGWFDYERTFKVVVTWSDNSTNEDGFILEVWRRNESNAWILVGSIPEPANATGDGFIFSGRQSPYKFRVKAFNASGDSAWSNWAH